MLVGSVANGLNSSGRFCTGSRIVVDDQCINGTSFVFSPAVLALSALEGFNIQQNMPSILNTLQENVCVIRTVLDLVKAFRIPSHAVLFIIHIHHVFCGAIHIHVCRGARPEHQKGTTGMP